jgi:hypothetical protein
VLWRMISSPSASLSVTMASARIGLDAMAGVDHEGRRRPPDLAGQRRLGQARADGGGHLGHRHRAGNSNAGNRPAT